MVPTDTALIDYYAKRAGEYERIYAKPERQQDLAALKKHFQKTLAGHDVLEVACGTGYWTEIVSQTAKSITATDVNDEVLQIARAKHYGCEVRFQKTHAFKLAFPRNHFSAGLAVAWWSHLRKSELRDFLSRFHRHFSAGALLVFMDNRFVRGSNTPIARTDAEGNTYQLRKLDDGSEHEVLKNFPTQDEVRQTVGEAASEFSWKEWQHFWLVAYILK